MDKEDLRHLEETRDINSLPIPPADQKLLEQTDMAIPGLTAVQRLEFLRMIYQTGRAQGMLDGAQAVRLAIERPPR